MEGPDSIPLKKYIMSEVPQVHSYSCIHGCDLLVRRYEAKSAKEGKRCMRQSPEKASHQL